MMNTIASQQAGETNSGLKSSEEMLHKQLKISIQKGDLTGFRQVTEQIKNNGQDAVAEARFFFLKNSKWSSSKLFPEIASFLIDNNSPAVTKSHYIHNFLKNCPLTDSFRPAMQLGIALSKATDITCKEQVEVIRDLLKSSPEKQFVGLVAALKLGILSEVQATQICFNNAKDPFGHQTGSHLRLKVYMIGYLACSGFVDKIEPGNRAKIIKIISQDLSKSRIDKFTEAFVPKTDITQRIQGIFSPFKYLFSAMPSFSQFCASDNMREIANVLSALNEETREICARDKIRQSIFKALYILANDNHTFKAMIDEMRAE